MNYEQLADAMAEAGFSGVEVTVREKEGYIHPAAAADELPRPLRLWRNVISIFTILTTDILSTDQPYAQELLQTAAALKIPRYRLGFYRYDLKQPILNQLAALQPKVAI